MNLLNEFLAKLLNEAKSKAAKEAERLGLERKKGFGLYGPVGKDATHRIATSGKMKGQLVPIEQDQQKTKGLGKDFVGPRDRGIVPSQPTLSQPIKAPLSTTADQSVVDTVRQEAEKDPRLDKLFGYLGKRVSRITRMMALKAFERTVESRLPADKKKQGRKLLSKIEKLLKAHNEGDVNAAKQLVAELQEEFKFYSNAAGTSFKTQAFGMGERHIVGKTALAKELVDLFDRYRLKGTPSIREAEDQDGAFKGKLESTSKAKVGEMRKRKKRDGTEVIEFVPDSFDAKTSPRVRRLLSGLPQVAEKFKSLYGPRGEDGDLLDNTGGKNSRAYFRHSVSKNVSLDETAAALESGGFPKMAQSVRDHKKRLENIEKNWDKYTPEEREKAVQQSYSDMAVQLHSTSLGGDSEMCNAIMKNLAEMSLYESELAGGKEVYLPAAGSFPAADKLIRVGGGTKAERIDKISVKYGKNGKVYGMPAQSSTIALMHTDKFYHNLTGGRVGLNGYETGVSGSVLVRGNWDRLMKESGYGDCLTSKKAGDAIRTSFVEAQTVIARERAKLRPQPPTNKAIARMMKENKFIKQARKAIAQALENGVDQDKLLAHGGEERVTLMRNHPMAFASMMTMDATIASSGGLPDLKHAHMEMIDEDGDGVAERMGTEVEDGDTVLPNWHFGWREADERGGGLLVGFARNASTEGEERPTQRKRRSRR